MCEFFNSTVVLWGNVKLPSILNFRCEYGMDVEILNDLELKRNIHIQIHFNKL